MKRKWHVSAAITALTISFLSMFSATKGVGAEITITVTSVHSDAGDIYARLFNNSEGFPDDDTHAHQTAKVSSVKGTVKLVFNKIPPGKYAIAIYHDENGNGKMDTNFLGIPKDGYGVSNDAVQHRSKPSFGAAEIDVADVTTDTLIPMHY